MLERQQCLLHVHCLYRSWYTRKETNWGRTIQQKNSRRFWFNILRWLGMISSSKMRGLSCTVSRNLRARSNSIMQFICTLWQFMIKSDTHSTHLSADLHPYWAANNFCWPQCRKYETLIDFSTYTVESNHVEDMIWISIHMGVTNMSPCTGHGTLSNIISLNIFSTCWVHQHQNHLAQEQELL